MHSAYDPSRCIKVFNKRCAQSNIWMLYPYWKACSFMRRLTAATPARVCPSQTDFSKRIAAQLVWGYSGSRLAFSFALNGRENEVLLCASSASFLAVARRNNSLLNIFWMTTEGCPLLFNCLIRSGCFRAFAYGFWKFQRPLFSIKRRTRVA